MGTYYSPEFSRQSPSAFFGAMVSRIAPGVQLRLEVEHRDTAEEPWAVAGHVATFAGCGAASAELGSLRAVLRLKATARPRSGELALRFHEPKWRRDQSA